MALTPKDQAAANDLAKLDDRTRTVFRSIVEEYLTSGEPVGSRNLARVLPMALSPASVRNVMADLERVGLLYAPHTSAGRLPTESGLRLFVDGLLEVGNLADDERRSLEAQLKVKNDKSLEQVLGDVTELVSGLSRCAGVVLAEKRAASTLKHIEFVALEPRKALVVLVADDQTVENRIVALPPGLPPSALVEAANYLNARIRGKTLIEARAAIEHELSSARRELDTLTQKVVQAGLATWSGAREGDRRSLIVRGQANLLADVGALDDLARIRQLFDDLEHKKDLVDILGLTERGEGVSIFIGSENKLFSLSGSSLIVAPFKDEQRQVVGVLGVIGPKRLNYGRIIPMVDYTARLVGRLLT